MENSGIVLQKWRITISWAILVLFGAICVNAQSFPVTITVQTFGAAPTQLSSFADAAQVNGPLRVTLTLNDLNITGREIQLRSSFLGNGINFQSVVNPVGASPFFLDGGIPLTLNAAELSPYFELANVTGISPAVYGRTLQEGAYQICFEVFDVLTGKRLSARSCANVFIFQNRPPFLVLPQNGVQVDRTNPQNIVFQWTPRQLNVTHVEYELSLVELWDNTIDPQAAFLATPPIFQTTTRATSYLYGPADPVLLSDHAYAWRVRAKAVDGTEAIGQFENQGYSEIFSFVHLAPCEVPPNLRHEVRGSGQANILWDDPSTEVPEFTVRYRQKGEGNAWFLNRTNANWTTLWDLRAGMPYEYQLKKDCGLGESGWSPVRQFTTALETEVEELYQCGISPRIDIQNQEPLPSLLPGQQFTAGDFTVITTTVFGSNGYYSGKGYVRIPYLGNVKLAVHFDNVLLNTDRQLLQGTVITEFDPTMRNIVDAGDVVETVEKVLDTMGDLLDALSDELDQIVATIKEDWEINRQVDTAIEILETNLDDPNNGLTNEQKENIRNFISDREKVRDAIITEKENIANGERDEVIKQNLVNHLAENAGEKSKNLEEFKIHYCDSIVKIDKHNDILKECNRLKLKYQKEDSTATKTVQMKLKVIPSDEAEDRFFPSKDGWQSVKYNEDWEVDFDSIPSGEYLAELKLNDSIYTHEFRMQKKCTSGYCCTVCGRDLTINISRLKKIFDTSESDRLTESTATIFTKALKDGGFKTCKQNAHFFSQIILECNNFNDFKEGYWYKLLTMYRIFGRQTGNDTKETLYSQSFWDDEQYIDYISSNGCPHRYVKRPNDTTSTKYKASTGLITKSKDGLSISFPKSFSKSTDSTAIYNLKRVDSKTNGKNLFNLVYKNKNGNSQDGDGWKYRGRGIIQLTGRENYRNASFKANTTYGTAFDWETNPDKLETDTESIIYSATSWFLNTFKPITILDGMTSYQVTKKVNTASHHKKERKENYDRLTSDIKLYKCDKK